MFRADLQLVGSGAKEHPHRRDEISTSGCSLQDARCSLLGPTNL
jgi:hypothetical protein